MKIVVSAILTALALFSNVRAAVATPAAVVLLRHAEKPPGDEEGIELSPRGWDRSKALPSFFHNRAEIKPYGLPVALFAMGAKDTDHSVRAIETLKYLSSDLNLTINKQYTKKMGKELANRIMNDRTLDGKLVVICWNHDYIDDVAEALGVEAAPKYPGSVFDRAWLVKYGADGSASMTDVAERLLPGDSQR
jgi:hypothetical protein